MNSDISQAGVLQEAGQSRPDIRIATTADDRGAIQLAIALERGAVGIREVAAEVDIFHRHPSPAAQVVEEHSYEGPRILQVRQQKPRVDDVEAVRERRVPKVRRVELDVRYPESLGLCARDVELRLIDVEAEGFASRTNTACELDREVTTTAAEIRADEALMKLETIQERRRSRMHDARDDSEPLAAVDSPADDIGGMGHQAPPVGR